MATGDDAVRSDEVRLGRAEYPVRERDAAVVVTHGGPGDAVGAHVRPRLVRRVLVHDSDEYDVAGPIPLPHAHESGVLLLAWRTPRREEVQDDDLTGVVAERQRASPVEPLGGERGGRLVHGAGADVVRV